MRVKQQKCFVVRNLPFFLCSISVDTSTAVRMRQSLQQVCILNGSGATQIGVGAEPHKLFPLAASNTGHLQSFQKQHCKNSKLSFSKKKKDLPPQIFLSPYTLPGAKPGRLEVALLLLPLAFAVTTVVLLNSEFRLYRCDFCLVKVRMSSKRKETQQ